MCHKILGEQLLCALLRDAASKSFKRLLVLKSALLVPPLQITTLHTEHVTILMVGLSRVKYCQIADMLRAPSDSCEINFFSVALKTVVAKGSTAQLPVLAFSAVKKN